MTDSRRRVLRFKKLLSPEEVERKLRGSHVYLKESGWADSVLLDGISFDLSKVEYADFGALAQLVQLVEGAARYGISTWVALPLTRPRRTEQAYIDSLETDRRVQRIASEDIRARVRRRTACVRFMTNCGFIAALRPGHIPRVSDLVTIEIEYDRTELSDDDRLYHAAEAAQPDVMLTAAPTFPHSIVPLQWITGEDNRAAWEAEVMRVLTLKGAGFAVGHAEAATTVVLRELIDNVYAHAHRYDRGSVSPAALIGAIVLRRRALDATPVGDRAVSEDYGAWIKRLGAPVVRVIVADSGSGIHRTLPAPPSHATETELPDLGRRMTSVEKSLFWSLSPWSTSRSPDDVRHKSVRGLASVRRVVREASGALLIRSGNAVSGMVYPDNLRVPVSQTKLSWAPGSLIDLALSPHASSRAKRLEQPRAAGPTLIANVSRILRERNGSIRVSRLLADIRAAEGREGVSVLLGKLPDDEHAYDFCSDLLHLAEEFSDRRAFVMIAEHQTVTEIIPRVRAFDDLRLQQREVAGIPVMLLDERGAIAWLGVDKREARLLELLQRSDSGELPLVDLMDRLGLAQSALDEVLSRLGHWLVVGTHGAALRVTENSLSAGLRQWMQERTDTESLGVTIRADPDSVLVTPTLTVVDRWIDAHRLADGLGGNAVIGYVLGRHMVHQRPDVEWPEVNVVRVGGVADGVIRAFAAALGSHGRVLSLSGEVGIHDDPEVPFVHPTAKFVAVADVVVSGTRVRHAIDDLVRVGAEPLAVATIVDGRQMREDLPVLGGSVPVISTVSASLVADAGGRHRRAVDPVPPERDSQDPPIDHPISHERLLHWCEQTPDALLTGHIARYARRHFSSFMDPSPLLEHWWESISKAAVKSLEGWLGNCPPPTDTHSCERIVILHPGDSADPAGRFASLVADAWNSSGSRVRAESPIPVERRLWGGRWVFPIPVERLPSRTGVLVVDWGAITLHTIQDLLRIAGNLGASTAHAIVFAGQLTDHDELTARSIRGIAAKPPAPREGTLFDSLTTTDEAELRIPARIDFLSSFRVGFSSASECATCRFAAEYAQQASNAPSELLRTHARTLVDMLEPRDLADARRDGPRDAFGDDLTPAQTAEIMRLRDEIEDSERSTEKRLNLFDRIESMTLTETCALVRLLALEPRLLKAAPLRFKVFRAALASAIRANIDSPQFTGLSLSLRRQHVFMLRSASNRSFLSRFPGWLVDCLRSEERELEARDLLIAMYGFAHRQYHQNEHDRRLLRHALTSAMDLLRSDVYLLKEQRSLEATSTLSALLAYVEYISLAQLQGSESPQEAWSALRRHYYFPVIEHQTDVRMSTVVTAVRVRRLREPEKWLSTLKDWQETQAFLVQHVLPRLPRVERIVLGHLYGSGTAEDVERWRRACTEEVISELSRIESLFARFVLDPEAALVETDKARALIDWWYLFFFDKRTGGLFSLLADCPCRVQSAVDEGVRLATEEVEAVGRIRPQVETVGSSGASVFCHPGVLVGAVKQVLDNAFAESHADDGSGEVRVRFEVSEDDDFVHIRVLNSGTRVSDPPGRGIRHFDSQLRNYGASLQGNVASHPWTYEARIAVPKWGAIDPAIHDNSQATQ